MNKQFVGGCLLALLATGCNSPSTPTEATSAAPAVASPAAYSDTTRPAAHMEHMTSMGGPASTGSSPRAQAMRLHDAAMNSMDALSSERQRLDGRLAQLSPSALTQAARLRRTVGALQQADKQMMDWMHNLQEPDSTSQPKTKVDAFWRQQLPGLQQLDQRIKAALDSAKAIH